MLQPRHIPLAAFFAVVLVAGLGLAVAYWNYEFIYYGIVLLLLAAAVMFVDHRVRLPTPILWALALWALAHLLGGTMPIPAHLAEPGTPHNLYNLRLHPLLPKYDQAVHTFGFCVATLAAWRALSVSAGGLRPTAGPLLAVVLIGAGLGAVNETIEFFATLIMPETNVGGYDNTGWDLVANLLGALVAAAIIRLAPPTSGLHRQADAPPHSTLA